MSARDAQTAATRGYAPVNGLQMYYEIEGNGTPLVCIPPVFGSAGQKSFPALAARFSVLTVDLQGHGRTADIPERPLTLEQCARDVCALLDHLGIARASFFGESYGSAIAALIALHHPARVDRVATYGGTFGPPADALNLEMLRADQPPTAESRCFRYQREHYQQVAPDPAYWPAFWAKVCGIRWEGFTTAQLASIPAPFLIALGDHDFVRIDHALATARTMPHAELAVIPDAGHFTLFSEPERVIPAIAHFLGKPASRPPIATAATGYYPGETR